MAARIKFFFKKKSLYILWKIRKRDDCWFKKYSGIDKKNFFFIITLINYILWLSIKWWTRILNKSWWFDFENGLFFLHMSRFDMINNCNFHICIQLIDFLKKCHLCFLIICPTYIEPSTSPMLTNNRITLLFLFVYRTHGLRNIKFDMW